MPLRNLVRLTAIATLLCSTAALAHHSNAMFDRDKEIIVTGTVRDFQWTNPHIFIDLMKDDPSGPYLFSIEGPTPSILRAHGWKFNSLKPGDKVVVKVLPLKDGRRGGNLVSITKDGVQIGDSVSSPGYGGGK